MQMRKGVYVRATKCRRMRVTDATGNKRTITEHLRYYTVSLKYIQIEHVTLLESQLF